MNVTIVSKELVWCDGVLLAEMSNGSIASIHCATDPGKHVLTGYHSPRDVPSALKKPDSFCWDYATQLTLYETRMDTIQALMHPLSHGWRYRSLAWLTEACFTLNREARAAGIWKRDQVTADGRMGRR